MKIKFNHIFFVYFISINMSFNIKEERIKLIQIINDNTFDGNDIQNRRINNDASINFLWQVLILTYKYPQIELYLKNLLNYFSVDKLENIYFNWSTFHIWSILHYMAQSSSTISLNAFEIIIKYGVNVNVKSKTKNTPTHTLLSYSCTNHTNNILNLFIKYGVDLNITIYNNTVLDTLSRCQNNLNEETQNCIMILIDFGATTKNPQQNTEIYDFIEYYKSSNIKPAIKK